MIEEHSQSYNALCDRLKDAKQKMDKLGVSPHIREHNKQTMRYVNQHDEIYFQMEDDEGEDFDKTKIWKVINYGKIGRAKETQIDSSSKTGEKY